jgi:serine/threonine protein kinase
MERMQCELSKILPQFVHQNCASSLQPSVKEIEFGPICTKLIRIVEAIHNTGYVLLDVKPENLMIASLLDSKTKATITSVDVADSIRLVDLGFIKCMKHMKLMKGEQASKIQGISSLYCSLHVHSLQAPSFRDDVYAMLYVIAGYILQVDDILRNFSIHGVGTNSALFFPWSKATSNAEIWELKVEEMKSIESSYFSSMPTKTIAEILHYAHTEAHNTECDGTPTKPESSSIVRMTCELL